MYKDAKGLWRHSITINGKRKVFSAKTKRDLMLKIAMFQDQQLNHSPKFRTIADLWQESAWDKISYGTQRCYTAPLADILKQYGDREVLTITPQEIQHWLNSLDLAFKSISTRKSVISQIYDFAYVELGMDIKNPCDRLKIDPKKRKGKRRPLTPEEIEAVKSTKKDEFILAPLILYTGCRCGEALALTYGDIDRKRRVIHINKSIDHVGNKPEISTTKTEAGNRDVPLLSELEALLPKKMPNTDFIIGGQSPITKSALNKRWMRWKKEHNVEIDRHQIRHTYASILYQAGVDPKSAQRILGHANFQTTMDIYTHLSDQHIRDALEKLETMK